MTLRLLTLLAAAALLAACQTDGDTACLQKGYAQGSPEYNACVQHRLRYINRAYGNCGHCAGGAGR
jgi:uncharacterized lipoprotein YajG